MGREHLCTAGRLPHGLHQAFLTGCVKVLAMLNQPDVLHGGCDSIA